MKWSDRIKNFFNPTSSEQSSAQPEGASSQISTSRSPRRDFFGLASVGDRFMSSASRPTKQRAEGNASELSLSTPLLEADQLQVASSQAPTSSIESTNSALSSQPKPDLYNKKPALYNKLEDTEIAQIIEIINSVASKFEEKERKRGCSPDDIAKSLERAVFFKAILNDPAWIMYSDKISPRLQGLEKQKDIVMKSKSNNEPLKGENIGNRLKEIELKKNDTREKLTLEIIDKISQLDESVAIPPKDVTLPSKNVIQPDGLLKNIKKRLVH